MLYFGLKQLGPGKRCPGAVLQIRVGLGWARTPLVINLKGSILNLLGKAGPFPPFITVQLRPSLRPGLALNSLADPAFACTQELLDQDSAQQPPSMHSHTFDCQALKPQISLSLMHPSGSIFY